MRRLLLLGVLALLMLGGCGGGYLHSHSHACTDGSYNDHRHWHPDDGRGGHHAPEGGDPEYHRSMAYRN